MPKPWLQLLFLVVITLFLEVQTITSCFIDLCNKDITGRAAEIALGKAEITVNKNMVPFDKRSPFVTSGMRVGTPAVTTRGLVESDMELLVAWMDEAIMHHEDEAVLEKIGMEVKAKMSAFPLVG